jgi:hypothetical protein
MNMNIMSQDIEIEPIPVMYGQSRLINIQATKGSQT